MTRVGLRRFRVHQGDRLLSKEKWAYCLHHTFSTCWMWSFRTHSRYFSLHSALRMRLFDICFIM